MIAHSANATVPSQSCRERTITIDAFAVDVLASWGAYRARDEAPDAPLFPGGRAVRLSPRTLDCIVKEALTAANFIGQDMSPRVLRNTYARRHLLAGHSNADVTVWLGFASERTVTRIRATIEQ